MGRPKRSEIKINLQPKQMAAWKALEEYRYTFMGGAKGGGKSWFQRAVHANWILTKENVTTCLIRRHYKELETNHINKIIQEYPQLEAYYQPSKQRIKVPETNSYLYFLHCKDENDLYKFKGAEFQLIGIDEVDNFPWQWVIKILQSNRSADPLVPARALLTGNPGGQCHHWLKRVFIDRDFRERERPEDYYFVQALLEDNKYLGEDYENTLMQEPNEALRNAYRFGAWDLLAGEFFGNWDPHVHVIEPLDPEKEMQGWFKFGALDWGFYHPAAFGWFAIHPQTQQVYLYREFLTRGQGPSEFKNDIFKYKDTFDLKWIVAGHDCWFRQRDGSPSVASKFELRDPYPLYLSRANIDRKQGWAHVRAFLSDHRLHDEKGEEFTAPRFFVTKNCGFTIDAFPRMQHKRTDPEDCEQFDCTENDPLGSGDDQIQMVRYGLMSVPERGRLLLSQRPSGNKGANHRRGVKSWVAT